MAINSKRYDRYAKARILEYFNQHTVKQTAEKFGCSLNLIYRIIRDKRLVGILKKAYNDQMFIGNTEHSTEPHPHQ